MRETDRERTGFAMAVAASRASNSTEFEMCILLEGIRLKSE